MQQSPATKPNVQNVLKGVVLERWLIVVSVCTIEFCVIVMVTVGGVCARTVVLLVLFCMFVLVKFATAFYFLAMSLVECARMLVKLMVYSSVAYRMDRIG